MYLKIVPLDTGRAFEKTHVGMVLIKRMILGRREIGSLRCVRFLVPGSQVLVARIIDSYIDGIYDVYVVLNGIYCPLLSNDDDVFRPGQQIGI